VQSQEDQLKVVQQAGTIDHFTAHCSCIAPTRPELLLCLKGNAAALSVSTALTATCQNAMAAIERSASAELLAHRPLALVCSPCIGDNSVLGTVSHLMAPMSLLTQSKPRKIEVEFMGLIPKFAYHFRLAKPRDFL
jgi:hypothetical protein